MELDRITLEGCRNELTPPFYEADVSGRFCRRSGFGGIPPAPRRGEEAVTNSRYPHNDPAGTFADVPNGEGDSGWRALWNRGGVWDSGNRCKGADSRHEAGVDRKRRPGDRSALHADGRARQRPERNAHRWLSA